MCKGMPLYHLPFPNVAILDNDQITFQVRLASPTISEKFSKIIKCGGNVIANVSSQTRSLSALHENKEPCRV